MSAIALAFGIPRMMVDIRVKGRPIHDLSVPVGHCVNESVDKSLNLNAQWGKIAEIAELIVDLRTQYPSVRIKGMVGDIVSAYFNIPNHASVSDRNVAARPELSLGEVYDLLQSNALSEGKDPWIDCMSVVAGTATLGFTSAPGSRPIPAPKRCIDYQRINKAIQYVPMGR